MVSARIPTLRWIAIVLVVLVTIAPYVLTIVSSLKPHAIMFSDKPIWVFKPTLTHYSTIMIQKGYYRYIFNSLITAVSTLALSLLIGIPAAYAFSRFRFWGSSQIRLIILFTCMAPPIGIAFPLYFLFQKWGLLGTRLALVIAHTGLNVGLVVTVMESFFNGISRELDESAMLDGAGTLTTLTRIILPVAKPGLVAVSILLFVFSWNEFLAALILSRGATRTLPVSIPPLMTPMGTLWGQVTALAVTSTIPIVIFTFFISKHLIRGLTFGALK